MGNWQNAESSFAQYLRDAGIPAYRDVRHNYSKKDFEVKICGDPRWKMDSKYRKNQPFRHHGFIREIEDKYCSKNPTKYRVKEIDIKDTPVLFSKNYKEDHGYVSIHVKVFAKLLKSYLDAEGFDFDKGWDEYNRRVAELNGESE